MPAARLTATLTAIALVCFAGNSLLTRMALGPGLADAASFTAVRLVAGALALALLARARGARGPGDWTSALALFVYAAPFTYAYLRLGAGVGALVLFGSVQATMIGWGLLRGERPGARVWLGLALALSGLAYLTWPGDARPDPAGVGLMVIAGVAWGAYSLRGRGGADPLGATTGNFLRTVPFALALAAVDAGSLRIDGRGIALAAASGAIASGIGYAVWYAALRGLRAVEAAVLQLAVPVLAAAGGVLLLGERVTVRLAVAGAAILGGVLLAVRAPRSGAPAYGATGPSEPPARSGGSPLR